MNTIRTLCLASFLFFSASCSDSLELEGAWHDVSNDNVKSSSAIWDFSKMNSDTILYRIENWTNDEDFLVIYKPDPHGNWWISNSKPESQVEFIQTGHDSLLIVHDNVWNYYHVLMKNSKSK